MLFDVESEPKHMITCSLHLGSFLNNLLKKARQPVETTFLEEFIKKLFVIIMITEKMSRKDKLRMTMCKGHWVHHTTLILKKELMKKCTPVS